MNKFQKAISRQKEIIEEQNIFLSEKYKEVSNDIQNNTSSPDQLLDAYNFINFAVSLKQMCHYFMWICYELIDEKKMEEDEDVKNHLDIIYDRFYNKNIVPEKIKEISKTYLDDFVYGRLDFRKLLKKKQFDLNAENKDVTILFEIK